MNHKEHKEHRELQAPVRQTNGVDSRETGERGCVEAALEPFLTKEEVARLMRKPVRTIEAWMERYSLPSYKMGQAVRFRWSEIQAFLAAHHHVEATEEGATTETKPES